MNDKIRYREGLSEPNLWNVKGGMTSGYWENAYCPFCGKKCRQDECGTVWHQHEGRFWQPQSREGAKP